MRLVILVVLFFGCFSSALRGHNIRIFAEIEGREISGYVYLSDGKRMPDVSVRVFTSDGELILQKRTNEDGAFQFAVDQRRDLTLVAETEDGHRAEWSVSTNEIPGFLEVRPGGHEGDSNRTSANDPRSENLELRMIIREELKPLEAQLNRSNEEFERFRDEIQWRDVLGGIGYLVGIAGIACCLRARKKQGQQ